MTVPPMPVATYLHAQCVVADTVFRGGKDLEPDPVASACLLLLGIEDVFRKKGNHLRLPNVQKEIHLLQVHALYVLRLQLAMRGTD